MARPGHLPKAPKNLPEARAAGPFAKSSARDAFKKPGSNRAGLAEAGRNTTKTLKEGMGHYKDMHIQHRKGIAG